MTAPEEMPGSSEPFGEIVLTAFVAALGRRHSTGVREYRRVATTFHALRAAGAALRGAPSTGTLRGAVASSLAEDHASGASEDPAFESLIWPRHGEALAADVIRSAGPLVLRRRIDALASAFRSDGRFALGADAY